jgi:hypothetical protein
MRLKQAVQDVTGGLVEHRGRKFPAPERDMRQAQFAAWTSSLSAADFSGVSGMAADRALELFRRGGWLEATGKGEFYVTLESLNGDPLYLQKNGKPLTLKYQKAEDLRLPFAVNPF